MVGFMAPCQTYKGTTGGYPEALRARMRRRYPHAAKPNHPPYFDLATCHLRLPVSDNANPCLQEPSVSPPTAPFSCWTIVPPGCRLWQGEPIVPSYREAVPRAYSIETRKKNLARPRSGHYALAADCKFPWQPIRQLRA